MGLLDDRVVVITGAGRGIGREESLLCASEGAKVVVNDLGGAVDGGDGDISPAEQVVSEIKAAGGDAVANGDDIADWDGAGRLIEQTMDTYGKIDSLINNAGILRDRMSFNMTIDEWDDVIRVHLRGHFCPTRHALDHMKPAGYGRIVNTSSTSGLHGNAGQANYGAAKAGIAGMTRVLGIELKKYGITCNAIAPGARTRMTAPLMKKAGREDAPAEGWDPRGPENIAPLVAYLASEVSGDITGKMFGVAGLEIRLYPDYRPMKIIEREKNDGPWQPQEVVSRMKELFDG